jgi:hypothetical protein
LDTKTAERIANAMRVYPRIYAIVPGLGLVTFYSQQVRAGNLVCALQTLGEIDKGSLSGRYYRSWARRDHRSYFR